MKPNNKVYPAVIMASGTLLLGLLAVLVLGRFQVDIWIGSPDSKTVPLAENNPASPRPTANRELATEPLPPVPTASPLQSPTLNAETPSVATGSQATSTGAAAQPGKLRVSNQTEHPVRVVLLSRQVGSEVKSTTLPQNPALESDPAHWDFAPSEGSGQGLILSLPEGQLQLKKGDILVAFAQDGSQRYWGPYVIGETTSPNWQGSTAEWQLVLQQ